MSLYELGSSLEAVINGGMVFNEETGEIVFDSDNLDALEMAFNDKLEGCGLFIKNCRAEADAIKAEEKRLKERREAIEKRVDRMEEYMLYWMDRTHTDKLETPRCALSIRKSDAVLVDDVSKVPDKYKKTKVDVSVDKTAAKKALKAGEVIPGLGMVFRDNLQVK